MKPPPLPGQSPEEHYFVRRTSGVPASPIDIVFPIVKWSEADGHTPIGTGFFVADHGIFVTAKHVVLDVIDREGVPTHALVAFQLLNESYCARRVLRFSIDNGSDIALGVLAQMTHTETGVPLVNGRVELRSTLLPSGTELVTYAYPRTEKLRSGSTEQLHFRDGFFRGTIRKYYPYGRDSVLLPGPCIETTMQIHGGASGGPVFAPTGAVVAVNSTGFDGTDAGFVTPINRALDLLVTDISIPGREENQATLRQLAALGFASYAV